MDSDEMDGCTHAIREAKLYTIPEVCKIIGFKRHKIYKLIKSGRLKSIATEKWEHRRVFGKHIIEFLRSI